MRKQTPEPSTTSRRHNPKSPRSTSLSSHHHSTNSKQAITMWLTDAQSTPLNSLPLSVANQSRRNRHRPRLIRHVLHVPRYASFPSVPSHSRTKTDVGSGRRRVIIRRSITCARKRTPRCASTERQEGLISRVFRSWLGDTVDPLHLWPSAPHRSDKDFLLFLEAAEAEGDGVFLWWRVSHGVPRLVADGRKERLMRLSLRGGRALVFFKYPIIGVLIEAVGFMGLFGYALSLPFNSLWSAELTSPASRSATSSP